jgi:hypothetical protein
MRGGCLSGAAGSGRARADTCGSRGRIAKAVSKWKKREKNGEKRCKAGSKQALTPNRIDPR